MKHFICRKCGNLVAAVNYTGNTLCCCKRDMSELTPSEDGAKDKHEPKITVKGNEVTVTVGKGESFHPQSAEHGIGWICLVTSGGSQRKLLAPNGKAEAHFLLTDDEKVISAFAYCNMHGLWVKEADS